MPVIDFNREYFLIVLKTAGAPKEDGLPLRKET